MLRTVGKLASRSATFKLARYRTWILFNDSSRPDRQDSGRLTEIWLEPTMDHPISSVLDEQWFRPIRECSFPIVPDNRNPSFKTGLIRYAIASFTISNSGLYAITNSFLRTLSETNIDGVEVRVFVNDGDPLKSIVSMRRRRGRF